MSELITPEIAKRLKGAGPEAKLRAAELLDQVKQAKRKEDAQQTFMGFVKYMWPAFIEGRHHKIMAEAFERIARGELKRLIVNMPPRHTKSEFASYLLPREEDHPDSSHSGVVGRFWPKSAKPCGRGRLQGGLSQPKA